MTLKHLLYFIFTFIILLGIYQIYWVILTKKSYPLFRNENETLFEYCKRQYQGVWKYLKRTTIGWFINSKVYLKLRVIFGVLLILLGICGFIVTHFIKLSDIYGVYLDIKL